MPRKVTDILLSLPSPPPPLAVLKTGVISQAAGSAYAEFGRTKVMVGVYGPRQSDRRAPYSENGRVDVDLKLATFATRQRGAFHQSPEEREMSSIVQTALMGVVSTETFPKAVLDVYCTVLEAGGAEVAVAVCAAALAVADAGVEMKDLVTACSVVSIYTTHSYHYGYLWHLCCYWERAEVWKGLQLGDPWALSLEGPFLYFFFWCFFILDWTNPCLLLPIVQSKVRGVLLLDPSDEEASREEAGLTVATAGIGGAISEIMSRGRWSDAELKEALELCLGGCAQLDAAGRQALKEAAVAKLAQGDGLAG